MNEYDKELARRIINRDEAAIDELLGMYGGLIKSIADYHLRAVPMWREDCVSDIVIAVWRNIDRYDPKKGTLKNWIGAVAKYRALNWLRKFSEDISRGTLDEDIADGTEIDSGLIREELRRETEELLSGLNESDREIFIRRYINEQSVEEISAAAHRKPSWIYNRISRGKRRLRGLYREKGLSYYEK